MSILFEKFEIIECLKKDAYSGVYLAKHIYLARQIVLKVLDTSVQQNSEHLIRFKREARILARLNHPNIIKILDFGISDDQAYLSFEYFESSNLRTVLAKKNLDFAGKSILFNQLIQGLDVAHRQGVIHRDLKPENILIDKDNQLKIADFGLSIFQDESKVTEKSSIVGTPAYMSPEQIRGESLTPHSDLFSLGIIGFELFLGYNPFAGSDINETINTIQTYDEFELTAQLEMIEQPTRDALARILHCDAHSRGETSELMTALDIESTRLQTTSIRFKRIAIVAVIIAFVAVFLINWNNIFTAPEQPVFQIINTSDDPGADTVRVTDQIQIKNDEIVSQKVVPGVLYFEVRPSADILLDGQIIKENSKGGSLSLKPGRYALAIKRVGYPSFEQSVSINETEVTSVRVNLDSLYGYIACQVHPWGNVYIANRYVGQTPLLQAIKLEPGQYLLRVENPNYTVFHDSLSVKPGDTTHIRINLAARSK
jgi:serine/threonine-protein kinase